MEPCVLLLCLPHCIFRINKCKAKYTLHKCVAVLVGWRVLDDHVNWGGKVDSRINKRNSGSSQCNNSDTKLGVKSSKCKVQDPFLCLLAICHFYMIGIPIHFFCHMKWVAMFYKRIVHIIHTSLRRNTFLWMIQKGLPDNHYQNNPSSQRD